MLHTVTFAASIHLAWHCVLRAGMRFFLCGCLHLRPPPEEMTPARDPKQLFLEALWALPGGVGGLGGAIWASEVPFAL
jgi:hypothetical protein